MWGKNKCDNITTGRVLSMGENVNNLFSKIKRNISRNIEYILKMIDM